MSGNPEPITKVLVVDEQPLVAFACRSLFSSDPSVHIDGAESGKAGFLAFVREKPNIVMVDVTLRDVSGFDLMLQIRKVDPNARIIIFSMTDDPAIVVRAIEMGARGFLSKLEDPQLLVQAILKVASGENFISPRLASAVTFSFAAAKSVLDDRLTPREFKILSYLRRGDKIADIAAALGMSYKTVVNTTTLLKRKLGARSHADLIRIAVEVIPR